MLCKDEGAMAAATIGKAVEEGTALGAVDVPFEFVGKVARAGAVAEARDVERSAAAARHGVFEERVVCRE